MAVSKRSWTPLPIVLIPLCLGFTHGPPMEVCQSMFPSGHYVDARADPPPFTFQVNATTYNPGDVLEVSLRSSGEWFYEGVFIQSRVADCSKPNVNVSFGEFRVLPCDDFLIPRECNDQKATAIGHYTHRHVTEKTFYWVAPKERMGHFYFRGTIARKQTIFWTNVFSEFIIDPKDKATPEKCPVISKYTPSGCSSYIKASSIMICVGLWFLLLY